MKQNKRKEGLFFLLLVAMFITLLPTKLYAATFSDIQGHWAQDNIEKYLEKNVISGYVDGTFRPDKNITRSEFVSLINRGFNYTEKAEIDFKDISEDDWYYEELRKAVAAGYLDGYVDKTMKPEATITRQEVAKIIAVITGLEENEYEVKHFKDLEQISSWSRGFIGGVVEAGYMIGCPDEEFKPTKEITRAEVVVALNNIMEETKNSSYEELNCNIAKEYGPEDRVDTIEKNVIISTPGVVLRNMIIKGDVVIGKEVAEGDAILDNITVEGTVYVYGGGENSIIIKDSSLDKIRVNKINNKVRILAKGTTTVSELTLESGASLEEENLSKDGFKNIIIDAKEENKIALIGEFDSIKVISKNAIIDLINGTKVREITLNAKANIIGKGIVENAFVNVDGVQFEKEPNSIKIADGVKGVIIKNPKVESKIEKEKETDSESHSDSDSNSDLDQEEIVDKTELQSKVTEAIENKKTVKISIDGQDIAFEHKWVTEEDINKYIVAIKAAQEVLENKEATQKQVNLCLKELNKATEEFNKAKKNGNKKIVSKLEVNLNKEKYKTNESISLLGEIVDYEESLKNIDVSLKLTTEDKKVLVLVDQIRTDSSKKFNYVFRVPEETELGIYRLIIKIHLDEENTLTKELDLVIEEGKLLEVDKTNLQRKVSELSELTKEDYTEESWLILEEAVSVAKGVLEEEVTQEEVDKALRSLERAIEELEERKLEVDKSNLETKVSEVLELIKSDYTEESWQLLEEALTVAKEVLEKEEATQEEVDEALTSLEKAIEELQKDNGEKAEVQVNFNYEEYAVEPRGYIPESGDLIVTTVGIEDEEIESVEIKSSDERIVTVTQRPEYIEGGFPKSKTRAFGEAIAPGETAIIATVTSKDGNIYTGQCKIIVRVKEKVDKTNLETRLSEVSELTKEDYTEASWLILEEALTLAKEVLEKEEATQEEVDEALINLEKAIEELQEKKLEVDKTNLEIKVLEVLELIKEDYTEESWQLLEEALTLAKEVLEKEEASQEEVDKVLVNVIEAIEKLEEKSTGEEEVGITLEYYESWEGPGKVMFLIDASNLESEAVNYRLVLGDNNSTIDTLIGGSGAMMKITMEDFAALLEIEKTITIELLDKDYDKLEEVKVVPTPLG